MAINYKSSISRYRRYVQGLIDQPIWKTNLFFILTMVLLIIMVVFALRPTLLTIFALQSEISQKKEVSLGMDKRIQSLNEATANLREIEDRLDVLDKALPDSPRWEELSNEILGSLVEGAQVVAFKIDGFDTGVKQFRGKSVPKEGRADPVESTQNGTASDDQDLSRLKEFGESMGFEVTIEGEYIALINSFNKLENTSRVLNMSQISIKRNVDEKLMMVISGEAFFSRK